MTYFRQIDRPACVSASPDILARLAWALGLIAAALVASAVPAVAHGMMPDRSYLENGALHGITAAEIMLPGIATGTALAQLRGWTMVLAVVFLSLPTVAGAWLGERYTVEILPFLNPSLVIIAGVLMLSAGPALRLTLFPALIALGLLFGAAFFIDGPGDDEWPWFAAGVYWAAAAAAIAATALWSWLEARWLIIATRICGSWLLAIGAIMLALGLRNLGGGTSL